MRTRRHVPTGWHEFARPSPCPLEARVNPGSNLVEDVGGDPTSLKGDALDVRLRAVIVLLEPALTLACVLGVSMADLVSFTKHVYVRVGMQRGHSVRGLASRFDVAPATIQSFKTQARDGDLAVALGVRMTRHRDVVALLTRRGSADTAEIEASQPAEKRESVRDAVADLMAVGIIEGDGDRFRLHAPCLLEQGAQVGAEDDESRLDALRLFVDGVRAIVHRRFFTPASGRSGESFARAVRFGVRSSRLGTIRAELFEAIKTSVVAADAELPDGVPEKGTATLLFAVAEDLRTDAVLHQPRRRVRAE